MATSVSKLLHEAHLRYQRSALRPESTALPCAEIRGTKCRNYPITAFKPEWFTHLRANFWRSYIDTLIFMSKVTTFCML